MRFYERFGDKGYHSSIATTFGIDFDAYESIALPRLRGAGCRNNIVLADNRMLTYALSGDSPLPRQAGRLYTVSGASSSGVFHPKLFLQIGRNGGRLFVGSANITSAGLAGNLELVAQLSCGQEKTSEQGMIAQAWRYLAAHLKTEDAAQAAQIEWMMLRAPWLMDAAPIEPFELSDGTRAALLVSNGVESIGSRFAEKIKEDARRLIIISPYWDKDLGALKALQQAIRPTATAIVLDSQTQAFPASAIDGINNLELYTRHGFHDGRFIHAKAVLVETDSADHLLIGSANCTRAALGALNHVGYNDEASLYRKLPPNSVLASLGLVDHMTEDRRMAPSELPDQVLGDDIPLDEMAQLAPGKFTLRADSLLWNPAASITEPQNCTILLLSADGCELACGISAGENLTNLSTLRRYLLSNIEVSPAFAQILRSDGTRSAPAIIMHIDALGSARREIHSRGTENLLRLVDGETEATLSLLEVLDVLERIEASDRSARAASLSIRKENKGNLDTDAQTYRTLSYEEFIASRRPHRGIEFAHSSFSGSDVSIVRGLLNRIIGIGAVENEEHKDDEERMLRGAFDLGDETDDAEAALSAGQSFEKIDSVSDVPIDEERQLKNKRRRNATKTQLISAMKEFSARISSKRHGDGLGPTDFLKLRALLMIVSAAAFSGETRAESLDPQCSGLQVLAAEGDEDSWPVVMGRLLFSVFGGPKPAIKTLSLSDDHDQVPGDLIECWATCYWCLQTCLAAPLSTPERARIKRFLLPVAERTYRLTLPSPEELMSAQVVSVMELMSRRYAERLDIDPEDISTGHSVFLNSLFQE